MEKYLIGVFVSLFLTAFGPLYNAFAHGTINFNGTVRISGLNEKIVKEVTGEADISQWGHGETNGNFVEAIYTCKFESEDTECGNLMNEETGTISAHRKNEYDIESKKFPLGLDEDGLAGIIGRI